jgi:hypothetical protein
VTVATLGPPPAPWRSGYAAACKAVYSGSNPDGALPGAHRLPQRRTSGARVEGRAVTNRWAISRIETLSDGVFAIAITLLVLLRARGDKASAATSG